MHKGLLQAHKTGKLRTPHSRKLPSLEGPGLERLRRKLQDRLGSECVQAECMHTCRLLCTPS